MSWPQGSLSSTQPHPRPPGQDPRYTVGKEHTMALTQPTLVRNAAVGTLAACSLRQQS